MNQDTASLVRLQEGAPSNPSVGVLLPAEIKNPHRRLELPLNTRRECVCARIGKTVRLQSFQSADKQEQRQRNTDGDSGRPSNNGDAGFHRL